MVERKREGEVKLLDQGTMMHFQLPVIGSPACFTPMTGKKYM
jgi:hypothetical protein